MGGDEDAEAGAGETAEQVPDLADAGGVEAVGRLVEDEQLRPSEESLGDAETLAHPQRVRADALVEPVREGHELGHALDLVVRHSQHAREVLEVLPPVHAPLQGGPLHAAPPTAHGALAAITDAVASA